MTKEDTQHSTHSREGTGAAPLDAVPRTGLTPALHVAGFRPSGDH